MALNKVENEYNFVNLKLTFNYAKKTVQSVEKII